MSCKSSSLCLRTGAVHETVLSEKIPFDILVCHYFWLYKNVGDHKSAVGCMWADTSLSVYYLVQNFRSTSHWAKWLFRYHRFLSRKRSHILRYSLNVTTCVHFLLLSVDMSKTWFIEDIDDIEIDSNTKR